MSGDRGQPAQGQGDDHYHVRKQLIALIKKRNQRRSDFTWERPTNIRRQEIYDPETGMNLTPPSMWRVIEQLLESGVPLTETPMYKPPGEIGWVLKARLAPGEPRIYVKLQIVGGRVLLRSFHLDEYDHD